MNSDDKRLKNLKSLALLTPEQRAENVVKSNIKKARTRERKEQFAIGANFAVDVLAKKKEVKVDGKKRKMTVYELATERCVEMLLDRDNPRLALDMLKFLNELAVGNPKLYQQININTVQKAQEAPQTAEERKAEFRKLMGLKDEAEEVQYEVRDEEG